MLRALSNRVPMIRPHFLEAEVSISTRAFNRIVQDAITAILAKPGGFWIETLHFFKVDRVVSTEDISLRYSIADIPDANGHFSKTITDDQFKAAILEAVASDLLGVVKEICELEYWQRIVSVQKLDRMPRSNPAQQQYQQWLENLPKNVKQHKPGTVQAKSS
jgi:hypothetical protein